MLQVFPIYANFSRLFLSAILYDLSAILQAERLAFRLYDALKFVVLVPLVFSQFYNIQNTADLRLYTKYELWSMESFDYTQVCRIKGCGGAGFPPPIIFERLKLPHQIIYRRKENLSESPNHLKYRENNLISRFYEHFSRNSRNLGHFWKFGKISDS